MKKMNEKLPIIATLLVIALLIPATSASPDISVEVISEITYAPDVQAKLEAISANLITEEMNAEISGAYRVMAVCFVEPAGGSQYQGELYVTVLSATDWCAVTSKVNCNLNVADSSYKLIGAVEHDVPLPSVPFDDSEGDYAASKGLADTPCNTIPTAVAATKKIHNYFKAALGSSTRLIGSQAKRSTIYNQLRNNGKLIAWSNIGHGSPTGLVMYDGTITSSNFCNMPKWKGLKDCVCFVNSCSSCLDPLKSCILGGSGGTPDHEVRTYISGLVGLPIGPSDDTDREFWQHTLLECWDMEDALEEAEDNHGLGGYYCLIGDSGKFFPPLVITTTVEPASCVVRPNQKMTITAKAERNVFPGEEVCLYIYNMDTGALVLEKCWTITKKTKKLFTYNWKAAVDPGEYVIEVIKEDCDGVDVKFFAVDPKAKKLFTVNAFEGIRGIEGQATGWVKPTKYRTIKTSGLGAFGPETLLDSSGPFSTHASKKAYSVKSDKTYNGGTYWANVLTGTYRTTITYGKNKKDIYSGKCWIWDYDDQENWYYEGGSNSHLAVLQREGSSVNGFIEDWTKAKIWNIYTPQPD